MVAARERTARDEGDTSTTTHLKSKARLILTKPVPIDFLGPLRVRHPPSGA